jgi:hypothetical protein
VKDNTQPDWTPRIIATFAVGLVLAAALSFFNGASRATEPAGTVATSCSGFAADAHKLFNKGDTAVLSGTFAPGDHVHLAIDFRGVGYSWQLTGVLGAARTDVAGSGSFISVAESTSTKTTPGSNSPRTTVDTTFEAAVSLSGMSISTTPTLTASTTSATSHGDINGFARLDVDVDVTTAGDGAITINEAGSVPLLLLSPRVAIASCTASNKARPLPSGEVSSSGPARGLSAPLG